MRSVSTPPSSINRAARRRVCGRVLEYMNQPVSETMARNRAVEMAWSRRRPHFMRRSSTPSPAAPQVREEQRGGVDALLFHGQDHGGGGAERVAIGADVGGHEDALAARERVEDLLVGVGVGHGSGWFGLGWLRGL